MEYRRKGLASIEDVRLTVAPVHVVYVLCLFATERGKRNIMSIFSRANTRTVLFRMLPYHTVS